MWDDSEFTSPDYSQYDFNGADSGGYDMVGQDTMQDFDTSNFWDQSQPQMNFGDMFSNQGQGDFNSGYLSSIPQGWNQLAGQGQEQFGFGDGVGTGVQFDPNQTLPNEGWGANMGGMGNTLQALFNNKGLLSVVGALAEGRQNKQMSKNMPQIIQQMRSQASPFDAASSQIDPTSARAQALATYKDTLANPYGQKIVADQVAQLQRAQAIKDAAAGRRSNTATSSPALLAAQAQVAQQYLNQVAQQAGAGQNAGMGGLEQLLQANKYGTNGYVSPLLSAAGYNSGTNNNTQAMQQILQKLSELSGGK